MTCKEIKEILWLYKIGEGDPFSVHEIQKHLQECKDCSTEGALLEEVLKRLPHPAALPEHYWDSYQKRVLKKIEESQKSHFLFFWRWAPAFALAVLLIGGTFFYIGRERSQNKEIIPNLELLENLELLMRDDFEKIVSKI